MPRPRRCCATRTSVLPVCRAANGPFAIELSSRRVREASRLLDGVRQGQPLGALLGYRVERRLHETVVDNGRTMDRFIAPLRSWRRSSRAPPPRRPGRSRRSPPTTSSTAWCCTAGGKRSAAWSSRRCTAAGLGTSDLSAISSILDRLGDAIDGLSDALTAETAYQMVRGNTSRTASTLTAIAQGDAPPPELRGGEARRAPARR